METHGGVIDPEDGRPKHYHAKFGKTPEETWVTFKADAKVTLADLMRVMQAPYNIQKPVDGWRKVASFTDAEKAYLRPIAETLAMLDGNAFFGMEHHDREHYEGYLPEAYALFEANGGLTGWAGEASFVKNLTADKSD